MKELNYGPVANPDGTPTALTRAMLAGTGRDPVAFALAAAASRALAKPGAKWTPETGWTNDPLPTLDQDGNEVTDEAFAAELRITRRLEGRDQFTGRKS